MKTPIFFVSDNHFQKLKSEFEHKRRKNFYSLLNHIADVKGTLIIGGDFFDFWFEFKKTTPQIYNDIFERLEDLKNNKIDIHYIAGNHDYWNFGYFEQKFLHSFYKQNMIINDFNDKILITHGDGLLKKDIGYRALKKVIRNKLFMILFKLLGQRIGYKIGQKVSHTSQGYNHFDNNVNEIIEDISEFADQKWKEGVDIVLIGHYHQKLIIEQKSKLLIFMGDWLKHYSVTKYDGNKWTQFSCNEL
jgi:UDP-2,3-diacylglucosamine hydrolase